MSYPAQQTTLTLSVSSALPPRGAVSLEEFVARLGGGRRLPSGSFLVKCPAHEDSTASLVVSEGWKHPIVLNCKASCSTADVLAAEGLTMRDICADDDRGRVKEEPRAPKPIPKPAKPRVIVLRELELGRTRFNYRDVNGKIVLIKTRIDLFRWFSDGTAKPDKDHVWHQADGTPGANGIRIDSLQLWGTLLAQHHPETPVVVVEGPKKAARLHSMRIVAVSVDSAGSKPDDAVLEFLRGRDVILSPDYDKPGLACMDRLAKRVVRIAKSVRVVQWPEGTPQRHDLADVSDDQVHKLLYEATPIERKEAA